MSRRDGHRDATPQAGVAVDTGLSSLESLMFAKLKSGRCGRMSSAVLMITQALVWGGVTIAIALELRGSPAADSVMLWLSTGAFTSLLLASSLTTRTPRDDCSER